MNISDSGMSNVIQAAMAKKTPVKATPAVKAGGEGAEQNKGPNDNDGDADDMGGKGTIISQKA